MTLRVLALAACLALVAACPAAAEDPGDLGGWVSREDAAKAAGAGARVTVLEEEIAALKAENAELRAGRDTALKLVEITEKVLAAQERLGQLADKERDAHKERAERLQKEKGQGRLWLRMQAWGATGALIGTGIAPGLGTAAGAIVGAGAGAIASLFDSP